MADHIAVGEVAAEEVKLVARHVLHHLIGDFLGLHGRRLIEGDHIGGNFLIDLQVFVHLAGAVSVPEVGHVAELLRLREGIFPDAMGAEHLREGVCDDRRLHQIVLGDIEVAIVLEHTGKVHAGIVAPVKVGKVLAVKCQGDLLGAVAAEVEEHHAVAVGNFGHGLAILGDDKRRQILIDAVFLRAVGFNGSLGVGELTADALNMGAPAGFHHGPVGLIAIHSDLHAAAAGSDLILVGLVGELTEHILQLLHILQRRGGRHVAAIEENMAVGALDAVFLSMAKQSEEVMDVGMDIAVGEQTQEMHGLVIFHAVFGEILPSGRAEQRTILNALPHQLGALGVDLAAAKGVVANLRVAHVLIGGKPHSGTVGFEPGVGAGGKKLVEVGSLGNCHSVAAAAVALANAVHDDQYNRFFH